MPAFTLEQLLLANQLMFPDTFEQLMKKHSTYGEVELAMHAMDFYRKHKSNLFSFIANVSRTDKELIEVLGKMIADCLHLTAA